MKTSKIAIVSGLTAAVTLTGLGAYGMASAAERKDMTTRTEESSVTTNDNGIVSRAYTECTVTTNGNMVTERRRETRTNMDADGNVLETSTSEFAQSYSVGDDGVAALTAAPETEGEETEAKDADSFLGLAFGETFGGEDTEFEKDPEGPAYLRASFTPETPLDGFDDYFVYVTPKTHRVAKIYACSKNVVDPGPNWRRHYLIEAMEKRYGSWARPCSTFRPCYWFRIGQDRFATVCLAGASPDYETVIAAWDRGMEGEAASEFEELRDEARKNAAEKRNQRVEAAAAAF